MPSKCCSKCQQDKPLSAFGKDKNRADGLCPQCKECKNAGQRAKYAADPVLRARKSERQKRYLSDPIKHAEHMRRKADWYKRAKQNKEKYQAILDSGRKSDCKRAKQKREYNARWARRRYQTDKAYRRKVRDYHNARMAKRRGNGGSYTARQWREMVRLTGGQCVRCGATSPLEADHITPVSLGGGSDLSNIQPLCVTCNRKKSQGQTDYREYDLVAWATAQS